MGAHVLLAKVEAQETGEDMAMSEYLLIESRDAVTSRAPDKLNRLALDLAAAGDTVTIYLTQDGVAHLRTRAAKTALDVLARAKVRVLADDFSLRERAIRREDLPRNVAIAPIETVVDRLAEGAKCVFY